MKKITIAIDGYSSCGKSTLAKDLAKILNYTFIDSGAMYRGVALYCLNNNIIQNGKVDHGLLIQKLEAIHLNFKYNPTTGKSDLYLNNKNVETQIRTIEVAQIVSKVALIKEVRNQLVKLQQAFGTKGGIVMDGRDIGTVVFPNAELKLFVTASEDIRTERRFLELTAKGESISREEIKQNLLERDLIDTTRAESPLKQAKDAITLDNSNLTKQEQLETVLAMVKNITNLS
ncbi:MAG: (d)CMP kinase [Crocinitomicaceae bacterium]